LRIQLSDNSSEPAFFSVAYIQLLGVSDVIQSLPGPFEENH